ncbi:hybrid sensor histidine kinase/response regulator transcription factor [Seonamhaeicola sp.]|uniref:hybrid sensor histidine kinase/response regulator transcription factor n=1 Tax=Seonamhaeicola sp. TaxID=1912245 RepID=UPI00260F2B38|nr:hybrid sensor histidine kinase/response regulator transcription factor [Seonamhaeicola sp.]
MSFYALSQSETLNFKAFVIEDGFASVNAILKDRNGFMWFGGAHGLYRYDGFKFKAFVSVEGDVLSLSDNYITALFEDSNGYIWIGTRQGGLNMFNPIDESFISHKNNNTPSIYKENYVTAITEDSENNLWVGTMGDGVFYLNKKLNTVENFLHYDNNINSITNNDIYSIIAKNGNVWITSNTGVLDCYKRNQRTFYHYNYSDKAYLSTRTGQRLCLDHKGNLWIGTEEEGLFKFNIQDKSFKHYEYQKGNQSISSNTITDVKEGKPNEIWFTTEGGGLNLLHAKTGEVTVYKNDIYNRNSITNNSSYSLFIDSNFDLWLGMGDGTVNRTNTSPFEVYQLSPSVPTSSLSFNVVVSLYLNKNILWIGTGGGGLDKFDLKTRTFHNYSHNAESAHSIPSNIVMSVIQDSKGNLWTGNSVENILAVKKPDSDEFYEPEIKIKSVHTIVFDLAEDDKGQIWIATYNRGLYVYNKTLKKYINYQFTNDSGNGLVLDKLLRLLFDSSGKLWIGTLNNGVQILDIKKEVFQSLQDIGFDQVLKITKPVRDIYEDSQKNIWITTEGQGVFRLNIKDNNFKHYSKTQGFPSNSVYGIIEDNSGNFWFGTNKGITTLNGLNHNIVTYNTFDGLPTNDFESGAIAKAADGKLFFGSKKGLVSFYPNKLIVKPEPINLLLTNFQIFNKNIQVNEFIEGYKPLDTSILFTKNISLPYNLNNFSFDFATPGYPAPHNIKYEYMLEGIDDRWISTPSEYHFASYSSIPPGAYTFKVKAIEENSLEKDNFSEKRLNIIITPVWWQTKLAYFIYSIILATLLLFIYYSIKNRIRLKNELLIEKYKHEKEEELHQSKINFFTTISHELRTSLTLILTPLEELTKIKNVNNRVSNLVMTMNRNGQRLFNLVTQILDFRKIESGVTKLKVTQVNLKDFFNELCIPFYQYAKEKDIQFQLTVSNSCEEGWVDTNKLEIIVYNMLSNAFKFTKDKIDINVDLDEKDERLIIKIKDNGKGIPEESISKVFEKFYQLNSEKKDSSTGSGIGLAIAKNLTDIHYGEILIKSELNEYTIFNIIIPITEKFYSDDEIADSFVDTDISMDEIKEGEIVNAEHLNTNLSNIKPILLIVEDNFEIRNLIKDLFLNDFKIITSSNGMEGCKKAFEDIPDIIISDIMMPEMNGLELCKTLKTDVRTSHIPIILLTARGSHAFQIEGLEYGADDYVTKPFNLDILKARVKNLIESRKALRETFTKEVLLKPKDVAINNVDEIFIEKIMGLIEEHMADSKFTVAKLAKEIGMSHSVLYRKIMALTGQNINEFLKSVKLSRAAQLIHDSNYTINEISDLTGFSNPKYFSTCFKKKYGVTPTRYRHLQS